MAFGGPTLPEGFNIGDPAQINALLQRIISAGQASGDASGAQAAYNALVAARDKAYRGGVDPANPRAMQALEWPIGEAFQYLSRNPNSGVTLTADQQHPIGTFTTTNPLTPVFDTGQGGAGFTGTTPGQAAPPTIDQQAAADQAKIEAEGQRQSGQSQEFITSDAAARAAARAQLSQALTSQAENQFQFGMPQTLEDLNARHLLNSSALPQEIARQQAQIAREVAGQTGVLGAQDIATTSAQRAAALTGQQSFQTAGLNRGFSLADFQRQADLSRQIGAAASPNVGGGKGAVGTTLSGVGALAPYAGFAATGNPLWLGGAAAKGANASSQGGGK